YYDEAHNMATVGELRHVYHKGVVVGSYREKSPMLLARLIERYDPDFAQRSKSELTGANGQPLIPFDTIKIVFSDDPRNYISEDQVTPPLGTDKAEKQIAGPGETEGDALGTD